MSQAFQQDNVGRAIAGYLIWGEIPDRWVLLGTTIIIASGLYVVYRETSLQRSSPGE